jgi:hypothetical protein
MSAGYSSTPLAKKIGVKEGHRLVLVHAPPQWTIDDLPQSVSVSRRRSATKSDVVIAFFTKLTLLRHEVAALSQLISADGALWLAWPRRAGGHESDITDNHVRDAALTLGLVDIKVAAIDEDWSALKFVWRKERRATLPTSR